MTYTCKSEFRVFDASMDKYIGINVGDKLTLDKIMSEFGEENNKTLYIFETEYGEKLNLTEDEVNSFLEKDDKCSEMVPESLTWCRHHYVPPVDRFISCKEFGNIDGMDGGCWWCMEMTPYQWHMCSDESWVRGLISPVARIKHKSREDAIKFIEKYKQNHPLGNERRAILSEKDE